MHGLNAVCVYSLLIKYWAEHEKRLRINFQGVYGLNKYAQSKFQIIVMQCQLISGNLLQLSCRPTCFHSWNKRIRCHLLVLKMIIAISDKVERFGEVRKHLRSLRHLPRYCYNYTKYATRILESWVTKPQLLVQSGECVWQNVYHTSYILQRI